MNEFTAKKIGEVIAFARVGNDTFEKGKEALECFLSNEEIEKIIEANIAHAKKAEEIAKEFGLDSIALLKADKTVEKITAMRDLYINGDWGNPVEISEWLGFYLGGAIVHWHLVKGASEQIGRDDFMALALGALGFHEEMLSDVSDFLSDNGLALSK